MAAFDIALIELGNLLGLFKPDGTLDWRWFGDPLGRSLASIPDQRERIGAVIRALLDRSMPAGAFDNSDNDGDGVPDVSWEPILDTDNVGLGVTWTSTGLLQIGLGAKANLTIGEQPITLAILARLLQIAGSVSPQLGQVTFAGSFPVPDFLSGGEIAGEVGTGANTVALAVSRTPSDSRQLDYPSGLLAWDAARLAVFVLKAWVAARAGTSEFFKRVDDHLFPMMGDPPGIIAPFPLVAPMKTPPNFDAWRSSVLTTDSNASGALTFLWHLRALLTGNDDTSFLDGSFHFPLSGDPQNDGVPPTLDDATGHYSSPTGTSGAWVGLLTPTAQSNTFTLVLDLETTAPARTCRIPLARWDGVTLSRPILDNTWPDIQDIVQAIAASPAGFPIGSQKLEATADGSGYRLSVLRTNVASSDLAGFNGDYDLAIRLESGTAAEFVLSTPALDIRFPPESNNPDQLLGDIVVWALEAAAPDNALGQLIAAAASFIEIEVTGGSPDAVDLLTKLAAVAGQGQNMEISLSSDASLDLEIAGGKLVANLEFGPIEDDTLPIFIGRLTGGLELDPAAATVVDGFSLGFENLRLGNEGSGSGIVASLIPDMRQIPGFHLAISYSPPGPPTVAGGGKVPIQRTIGPLEIAALLVDVREKSFAIGLDLGFELGPIAVAAYELGLRVHYDDGTIEPFLHGLGLAMDTGLIKLGGFFGAVENNNVTDYVGSAVVSVANYFELSAIGGYTQLPGDEASLFLFGSLVAPLGGPPWFFITGIAGGFGFNRSLPAPGLLLDHPFMKVMQGKIEVGTGNAAEALQALSVHFAAMKGQHWIAAGIQFTAFGFINGKLVVAIGFGKNFSMQILGMASFGIKPLCYFEIGIEATADEERFLLRARLSPNSYVIHRDIFSLQGDFALGVWYEGQDKGDFLFSIGGYHPLFKKPPHYPELSRVQAKAIVYNFVHLSVEAFFCCTPQVLMAGAKVSLWGDFLGIAAGFNVYADVLMKWDPFYLHADVGVHVWFEFFGRHEAGVDLEIWTPEFGGVATIDFLVEFDIDFGAKPIPSPTLKLHEFLSKQLGVPAKSWNGGAQTAAFSTESGAGLFRVEFLKGRPGNEEVASKNEKQEGLDPGNPVRLSPEWSFLVRTRLPFGKFLPIMSLNPNVLTFLGDVDIPLCTGPQTSWLDRQSDLTVYAKVIQLAEIDWLADFFPAAHFGNPVPEAQFAQGDSIAKLKDEPPSVSRIEGVIIDYAPVIPSAPPLTAPGGEPSDPDESYPIPLGASVGGPSLGNSKTKLVFGEKSNLNVKLPGGVSRRKAALAKLQSYTPAPVSVLLQEAELQRPTKLSAGVTLTTASSGRGIVVMSPPLSPLRPAEMFDVKLKTLSVRSDYTAEQRQMETVSGPKTLTETDLTPDGGVTDRFHTTFSVAAGSASHVKLGGGRVSEGLLHLRGDQLARALVFDWGGAVILDTYTHGTSDLTLPRGSAQALVIGEGLTVPPSTLGIERDSILFAAGSRQFVGHGCVAAVSSYSARTLRKAGTPERPFDVKPMDSLPGAALFEYASTLRVSFANATGEEGAFVLALTPLVERPSPAAEEVRWLAEGAQLRDLVPVIRADRVAFVMSVLATAPWSVTVDVGPDWRLAGIVFVPRAASQVVSDLGRKASWNLVDDAMPAHPPDLSDLSTLSTSVSLEAVV